MRSLCREIDRSRVFVTARATDLGARMAVVWSAGGSDRLAVASAVGLRDRRVRLCQFVSRFATRWLQWRNLAGRLGDPPLAVAGRLCQSRAQRNRTALADQIQAAHRMPATRG